MTQPIDLYYWPTQNGWKVAIALEEMALPYCVCLVDLSQGEQSGEAYLRINPNGKMPTIIDPDGPDGEPVTIFESGAILQYLARKSGLFGGDTERERIEIDQWLHWQMGGLGPMAGQVSHFLDRDERDEYAIDRYTREVARLYRVLDDRLADRPYVAGDSYSIADMAIWGWANRWHKQNQTLDDKPHLARWLKQVGDRPAVRAGRGLGQAIRDARTPEARAAAIAELAGRRAA